MNGKTLIFDWNCTLLDDFPPTVAASNVVFRRFGAPTITPERFRETFEMPIHLFYERAGIPRPVFEQNATLAKAIYAENYEARAAETPLREGARTLLELARQTKTRLLILSNYLEPQIRAHLRRLQIEDYFQEVIAYRTQKDQFATIPKGEKLALYMKAENLDPTQAVLVGDTPEETQIAHNLGLTGVALEGGYSSTARLQEANPHLLVRELTDLPKGLKARGFFA